MGKLRDDVDKGKQANKEINCHKCRKLITDYGSDLYHMSGLINGALNKHIHVCDTCFNTFVPTVVNFGWDE